LSVLGGSLRVGMFLSEDSEQQAVAVLGAAAAEQLGVEQAGTVVRIREHDFTVVGIIDPLDPTSSLYRDVDESALVGFPAAEAMIGFAGRPDTLYVRRPWVAVREGRLERLWRGLPLGALCVLMITVATWSSWM